MCSRRSILTAPRSAAPDRHRVSLAPSRMRGPPPRTPGCRIRLSPRVHVDARDHRPLVERDRLGAVDAAQLRLVRIHRWIVGPGAPGASRGSPAGLCCHGRPRAATRPKARRPVLLLVSGTLEGPTVSAFECIRGGATHWPAGLNQAKNHPGFSIPLTQGAEAHSLANPR